MLRKLLITSVLLAPMVTFAQANGNSKHAPEIDGSNIVLGIALLGGILSLARRRNQK